MLRKRPLVSRSYLGCPLRYLKTVLILPWIYYILDKADGLHHHGWIHIPRLAVPQAETYVFSFFFFFFFVFLSFHNRWMLKDMNYHFLFIALYIPFLCICTGGVCIHFYHWIHIVVLSIISSFCHWWPLRPKTQLIQHCHVKQLGDIFESKITYKFSFLHYKNGQLNLGWTF